MTSFIDEMNKPEAILHLRELQKQLKQLKQFKMDTLTFKEYQTQAITTKIYPEGLAIPYVTLGLMGEAGEVAEKVKKVIRDQNGFFTKEKKEELGKEIGDVLWYCAALADELGLQIGDIAQGNIDKLEKRKSEGKLGGSGDNR